MTILEIGLIITAGYLFLGILSQLLCFPADKSIRGLGHHNLPILALIWPAYWITLVIDLLRAKLRRGKWAYIPEDLDDAIEMLKKNFSALDLRRLKKATERDLAMYHHGFGRQLRNDWGLWQDSRLAKWFKSELGITHPDDMSSIIMTSLWRQVHDQPIKLEEQVAKHKEYWADMGTEEDDD